jgi:hypothetical protein
MPTPSVFLQELCQRGQELLMQTNYLAAETALADAEQIAWDAKDWDTLSRLYMPLQEARRQKRQITLEGTVRLNLPFPEISIDGLLQKYSQGEFLLAGEGGIVPGIALRAAAKGKLYLEAFLAAAYTIGDRRAVVIVGLENSSLPAQAEIQNIDQLIHRAPVHSLVLAESELADQTPSRVMALWQQLHLPYLAAADAEVDPIRRMAAYRRTIQVDNACELAHQKLADVAAKISRKML